jgi:hypothetical protein
MTSGLRDGEKPKPAAENREALELASQRRRRFLVFCCLLVAALLGGNLLYAAVLMTRETRSYCLACHRASGPALMWEASERHPEGLSCGQCHGILPGGAGRFGAFSARADTVNPHCVGCHGSVLDGRPLNRVVEVRLQASPESGAGPKVYRWRLEQLMYDWHLKKRVCLCTDCHRNVAHERESKAFGHRPKMAYCRACHYHAVKDDYVMISPLPTLEIQDEGSRDQGS